MKNKKITKPRLHPETVETLRNRGGAHGHKKGKKKYCRKREKSLLRNEQSE